MTEPALPDPALIDQLLDDGISFRQFRRHFLNRNQAINACADYHAARHAFPPPDHCCICGTLGDVRAQYTFQAPAHVANLKLTAGPLPPPISFWAFVTFCKPCHTRARWKRVLADVCRFISLFLGLLGAIPAVIGIPGIVYSLCTRAPASEIDAFMILSTGGAVLVTAAMLINGLVRRLRLPSTLRSIGSPFRFLSACRETMPGKFPQGPTAS